MGSLAPGTPCGWCGRPGAGYIPDGIDPPVPLCGRCLWGELGRADVMEDALRAIFGGSGAQPVPEAAPLALQQPEVLRVLAEML